MKKLFEINDIEAINTWLDKEKIFIQKEYKYETNPKNNWHRLYLDIATEFFLEENYSIKIETNIIDFRISLIYYRKWQLVRIEDCYHPNHFKKIPKYIFDQLKLKPIINGLHFHNYKDHLLYNKDKLIRLINDGSLPIATELDVDKKIKACLVFLCNQYKIINDIELPNLHNVFI